ncbi:MAG: hypothetical protein AAF846_04445 [Chloroflexota bacterium]
MTLNTLRIEPHIIETGSIGNRIMWKIWIDDKKVTDTCYPFMPNDTGIELNSYVEFPQWGYGDGHVVVRSKQGYVFWIEVVIGAIYDTDIQMMISDDSYVKVFLLNKYGQQVKQAHFESTKIKADSLEQIHSESSLLLPLTQRDISVLLKNNYPISFHETAIYREPKSSTDTTGTIILRRMGIAINNSSEFTIVDPPEKSVELRIGLDEAEFTETIWHIGKVNEQFAIYFEQKPSFPVWLQSLEFDKVLSQESFVKDL